MNISSVATNAQMGTVQSDVQVSLLSKAKDMQGQQVAQMLKSIENVSPNKGTKVDVTR